MIRPNKQFCNLGVFHSYCKTLTPPILLWSLVLKWYSCHESREAIFLSIPFPPPLSVSAVVFDLQVKIGTAEALHNYCNFISSSILHIPFNCPAHLLRLISILS
jgi:hypothetical protein